MMIAQKYLLFSMSAACVHFNFYLVFFCNSMVLIMYVAIRMLNLHGQKTYLMQTL